MDRRGHHNAIKYRVVVEVCCVKLSVDVLCSWIAFAPVAGLTRDYFGLASTTPVNWLSTVVLFVYCVVSPLTAYVFNHHGVRTGVTCLISEYVNGSLPWALCVLLLAHG